MQPYFWEMRPFFEKIINKTTDFLILQVILLICVKRKTPLIQNQQGL
jgi:hypothetical protein